MNKYGYYTKHFNHGADAILSFDAVCDTKDNHFEAGKLCNTNGFQVIEERKDSKFYAFTYNDSQFVKDIHCIQKILSYVLVFVYM